MSLSEFELIKRYFLEKQQGTDIVCGIGDDAAIIEPPADKQLVVAIDTLVAGVHFPAETSAYDIGWKALAVNLSDMAAMAAQPSWFTLALTLPESSPTWLEDFSAGLFAIATHYNLSLIGGDTTSGPLTISVQIAGYVDTGDALLRSGARPGDHIYVSGTIGDAFLGLEVLKGKIELPEAQRQRLVTRLNRPQPRVAEALALRSIACCAIDISDGLLADVQHMMQASGTGAELYLDKIPHSAQAHELIGKQPELVFSLLTGGDDYELCFCIPAEKQDLLTSLVEQTGISLTWIGRVVDGDGVRVLDHELQSVDITSKGYDHFNKDNK